MPLGPEGQKEVGVKAHRSVEEISWIPHATADGVEIKPMISRSEHGLDVTCMLVRVPAGKEVPEHIHKEQDDILYPLKGKATMWVEETGEFPLEPGVIVKVPPGKRHRITNVREDLLIYDVFFPALI
jgi:quercetin dioxygenase-like cupin family protein